MTVKFQEEIKACLPTLLQRKTERNISSEITGTENRTVHLVTGLLAKDFFTRWCGPLAEMTGTRIQAHTVVNRYFGPDITVAGLLTAQDIAEQLGDLNGDYFLIPRVMLKADEDIFLDVTVFSGWLDR
jgi:NifB/MoaA-like Fe-S oxidoreductase